MAFFVNDTGLLNFRFERVANSFIEALKYPDFWFDARRAAKSCLP
jgi:hypothetical protein